MKNQILTLALIILPLFTFGQSIMSPETLTDYITNQHKFKQEIALNPKLEMYYDKQEGGLTMKKYRSDEIIIMSVSKGDEILVLVQVKAKLDENESFTGRRYDIASGGWKEFFREHGNDEKNILSVGFKKGNVALLSAEYVDSYRESVCLNKNLKELQFYMR